MKLAKTASRGEDCEGMGAVVWMVVSFAVFAALAIGMIVLSR